MKNNQIIIDQLKVSASTAQVMVQACVDDIDQAAYCIVKSYQNKGT